MNDKNLLVLATGVALGWLASELRVARQTASAALRIAKRIDRRHHHDGRSQFGLVDSIEDLPEEMRGPVREAMQDLLGGRRMTVDPQGGVGIDDPNAPAGASRE